MKKTLLTVIFFVAFLTQMTAQEKSTQDSIKQFADSTFLILEEYSLYADKIDWIKRKKLFDTQTKGLTEFLEIFPFYQKIFDDLEDNHSFFWYDNQKFASNFGQLDESKMRPVLIEALDNGKNKITVDVIQDIGYIMIPQDNSSDDFTDMQLAAQKLQDSICSIYKENIKGWIIDLRLNTGGNMYPMIAGIIPFLQSGIFASTIDKNGNTKNWSTLGKAIFEGDQKVTELKEICLPDLTASTIVVLTSQITGSSGEITALSLLNRPNTHFIGENTAGYMTCNELFRLPFDVFLLLTNGVEADSNGEVVQSILPEQIMIEGDNFESIEMDLKVLEAIKWIEQNNRH